MNFIVWILRSKFVKLLSFSWIKILYQEHKVDNLYDSFLLIKYFRYINIKLTDVQTSSNLGH